MLKKMVLLLLVAVILAIPGAVSAQLSPGDFIDIRGHWAEQDILAISSIGLMNGTGTTDQGFRFFSPEGAVSRAQLAVVLQHTFQLDYGQIRFIKQPVASDYYRDVDNDDWYADALVICVINNIFAASGDFSPNRPVTRLEIAQAIYRCFTAKGISVPMIMMMPVFEDTNSLSQEDMNAVVFVNNTGIMKGDNNFFRPEESMTRAELAVVLNHCVSLMAVNESYNNKEYQVTVGQTFIVSLSSNPATGYIWNIKNAGDDKIVALINNTYQTDGNKYPPLMGQGGQQYWQFKALKPGTADLQLVYARPWESVQPAQVFDLKVIINESATSPASIIITNKVVKN